MVTMTQLILMMVKIMLHCVWTNPTPVVRVQCTLCTLCNIIVQCILCIPDPDLHRIAMQLLLVNMDRCND